MYNHAYPVSHDGSKKYDLRIVQSDDYGSLWNTGSARETLEHVEYLSQKMNTLVVLFIHGWHHDAAPDDANLRDFKTALAELHDELDTEARKKLRTETTRSAEFRIVGIFVGWRGRSLPSFLDYLTFWGRKSAAERVGSGDVFEFIERLQQIYLRSHTVDPNEPRRHKPVTGLVTIGHSFGAQVLWKSLARQLEEPLVRRTAAMVNQLQPVVPKARELERVAIDSLGDLNLLINPALEAYQFARTDALYRQLDYPAQQTPQLVIFSADNDTARKIWFPVGRGFSLPFRPGFRSDNHGYQGVLYGKALGEVSAQLTHTLSKLPDPGAPDSLADSDYLNPDKMHGFDFTGETVFGGIRLAPIAPAPGRALRDQYSPVLVVQSKDKIIDGHDGIFKPEFRHFLRKYVAFIEAKRLIVARELVVKASKEQEPAAPVAAAAG